MISTQPTPTAAWVNNDRFPCEICGGSRTVAIRSDGLKKCFQCETVTPPTDGATDYRQIAPRREKIITPSRPTIISTTDWILAAEYLYHDESGAVLYGVTRLHRDETDSTGQTRQRKDFRQWHLDPSGQRVSNMRNIRRVLWNLPNVVTTVQDGGRVWLCEGEKSAQVLDTALLESGGGGCATTASGGCSAWRQMEHVPQYIETLRGAHVVLWPDDDAPGDGWASDVGRALDGVAMIGTSIHTGGTL